MPKPAVLVTGGSKRIGAAISHRFAVAGWHVVIHYHSNVDDAQVLADTLPSAEIIACDLRDADAAAAMITQLANRLPDWRVLVNNASVFAYDDVTGIDAPTYSAAMQVNAHSPALMAQTYFQTARSDAGRRVIQITDMKLANTNPDFFSYTMSKHAVNGAIGMMAKATPDPRDRIYGVAPGAILASHDQTEGETDISHKLNLLQRKTGADEIADAALFLADGALASGETLYIDSGQHLLNQPRDVIYLAREGSRQ
ncbi:SDR family oxidoreductase [Parerythrobacter jejuensis]|uniref:SDR family oxidoreductase n=1 Tax=Parerythrobacter jejuensis TaxID=795812 RepID=A0A845AT55_9SPHN|nr:SDR family oxidoreductase [Parerythrobacter jejuensis]MXP32679.1 SDR family oxidoreductase [Parerythrobacter jejuensis]